MLHRCNKLDLYSKHIVDQKGNCEEYRVHFVLNENMQPFPVGQQTNKMNVLILRAPKRQNFAQDAGVGKSEEDVMPTHGRVCFNRGTVNSCAFSQKWGGLRRLVQIKSRKASTLMYLIGLDKYMFHGSGKWKEPV